MARPVVREVGGAAGCGRAATWDVAVDRVKLSRTTLLVEKLLCWAVWRVCCWRPGVTRAVMRRCCWRSSQAGGMRSDSCERRAEPATAIIALALQRPPIPSKLTFRAAHQAWRTSRELTASRRCVRPVGCRSGGAADLKGTALTTDLPPPSFAACTRAHPSGQTASGTWLSSRSGPRRRTMRAMRRQRSTKRRLRRVRPLAPPPTPTSGRLRAQLHDGCSPPRRPVLSRPLTDSLPACVSPATCRQEGPAPARPAQADTGGDHARGAPEPRRQPQQDDGRRQHDRPGSGPARLLRALLAVREEVVRLCVLTTSCPPLDSATSAGGCRRTQ